MEIRQVKKSEWDKLRVFNEAEYKPGHILTDKNYYDWQFDSPWNTNKDCYETLGLFDGKGDIVGTFGLYSAPHNYFGRTLTGSQLCNLMVKKELRALGYGYLLLEQAASLHPLAIDHTINETAWPMFMKAGWLGEEIRRFLYIINPKTPLYELPAAEHRRAVAEGWHFDAVTEFDSSVDIFWKTVKNRYPISIERSAQYLNWRYAKNPLAKYQIFAAKNGGEVKAVVVLRVEEPKMGQSLGMKVARIIDFVSAEDSEVFALDATSHYCRENKIDFIDYFTSGDFHKKGLREAGFVFGDEGEYEKVPILFNPVSSKRKRLNFAMKSKEEFKLKDCYTTKGGGDQDRPY